MKQLLAFTATFLAMAAADQDKFIVALIFMIVSVYLLTKSFKHEQH